DSVTGETSNVTHVYHECRYDPARRAFLGFRVVESTTDGDASIPGQRVVNTYHLGLDPANLGRPLQGDELLLLGALRRRLLSTEIYGLDGSADQSKPYRITRHTYGSELIAGAA